MELHVLSKYKNNMLHGVTMGSMSLPTWASPIVESVTTLKSKRRHTRKQLPYPLYLKNIDPDAHVPMFKAPIKANGETKYKDIVKMFMFALKDII